VPQLQRKLRQPGFAEDGPAFIGRGELVGGVEGAEVDFDLIAAAGEDRGAASAAVMAAGRG